MKKTRFQADDMQLLELAVKAINASLPMGMGQAVYQDRKYTRGDLSPVIFHSLGSVNNRATLNLDYFGGRMVKLHLRRVEGKLWEFEEEANVEYQSWAKTYPTNEALLQGIAEVIHVEN